MKSRYESLYYVNKLKYETIKNASKVKVDAV
jgi:hypothetical protein